MKIVSSRKDDILRRKAEWEENYRSLSKAHDEEYRQYQDAQEAVYLPVRQALEDFFSQYSRLRADIRVYPGKFGSDGLSVRIDVAGVDPKTTALKWSYEVYLTKGEIQRETSSWSGLHAVTADELAELEQSVACLKSLADFDWKSLLDRALPKHSDYVKTKVPSYSEIPDFDSELTAATLDELIGERKMIKVQPFTGSFYRGPVYIGIIRDSNTQYTIVECPRYAYNNGEATKYFDGADTHRVKKSSIKPVEPIEIIEV